MSWEIRRQELHKQEAFMEKQTLGEITAQKLVRMIQEKGVRAGR